MAKIVHSEIEGRSRNQCYWQVDVEALALEVKQLKAAALADERVAEQQTVEADYSTGLKQLNRILVGLIRQYGHDGVLALTMEAANGVQSGQRVQWACTGRVDDFIVICEAKAALSAGKGGGT